SGWSGLPWADVARSVRGPLLTLATVVLLDVLRRHGLALRSPFPIVLLPVIYTALVGGLRPALVSVVVATLYALHFFAQPGLPLRFSPPDVVSLLAVGLATLAVAVLVARLSQRLARAEGAAITAADAEALARRYSLLEQASLLLCSDRDFEAAFRDFARLLVPSLADWGTVHLAASDGTLHYVAGAHREPARDLVVRALAEYGRRRPPFDGLALDQRLAVDEALLRAIASDDEDLKLYRALAPTEVLRLPLGRGPAPLGLITLGHSAQTGRRFSEADLSLAGELAASAGLAVANLRLRREADQAERRARLTFEAHPQPMWMFDVDTLAFLAVNDAAVHHYGWSRDEFLAMTILDLLAPDDAAPTAPAPDRGGSRGEVALAHHRRRDGSVLDMEITSHELELDGRRVRLVMATDVTDRARARAALHETEDQLRRVQRVEALGRIAGGVAHDFNNVLTTIRGFGEMLLLDLVPDDRRRQDVERICRAADRGALLTRQLLAFGQHPPQEPQPVDLNEVVRGMESLTRRLLSADVQLELRLGSDLGLVRADPGQLEHVVVNLILGAQEAMPAGGRLTIETRERRISSLSHGRPVRPGRYVVLEVSDTGSGPEGGPAPADTAPRAELDRAIVFGIVRQYGGVVRVASEPGQGTTVKVYLPRFEPADDRPESGSTALWRGGETVLVAEDEDGVRELLRKALTGFGYTVLTARHGRDALMMAGQRGDRIDLLVTDVVMPEMSGRELAETLLDRRPGLKVLYISGYTDDEVLQRGLRGADLGLLRKPFTAEDLVRRVREVLDQPAG
ncbi:MAG TPA: response regulator, partial [Gemmatimonadales bacterium]|nr:response regulator [Gemmatimonadales bacterium]